MSLEVDTPVISWHALSPEPPPSFTLQSLIDRNMSPGASRSRFRTTFDWSGSLMRQKLAAFFAPGGSTHKMLKVDHAGFVVLLRIVHGIVVSMSRCYLCTILSKLSQWLWHWSLWPALFFLKPTFAHSPLLVVLHICGKPRCATCCKLYMNTAVCAKTWSWVSFGLNLLLLLPPLSHAAHTQHVHQNFDLMLLEYFTCFYCTHTQVQISTNCQT